MSRRLAFLIACWLGAIPVLAHATPSEFRGRLVAGAGGGPVAGAEVLIVGLPGSVRTDAQGHFTWPTTPPTPFEVLVVLPGGRVTRPTLIAAHDWSVVLTIEVDALLNEEVTVTAGVAPSIDAAAGAGMTMLTARDMALRLPANLNQALENVPGVSQVSEGHAAVPAVRGLARGRTLLLIDGARVTSERRVGPSATFLDPTSVEHIDIARGPGSVAYGSDAFGGVISVRTRRPAFNSGWSGRATGTIGRGVPDRRVGIEIANGYGRGAVLLQVHARDVEDYDGPKGPVLNSGYADRGLLARIEHQVGSGLLSVGWQGDFGRDIERPRNNSGVTRFSYPWEDSRRLTAGYEVPRALGLDLLRVHAFLGAFSQRTDQERLPTATVTRQIDRADVSASDFAFRATGRKAFGRSHVEFGADINGRFGLEAHDVRIGYNLAGDETSRMDVLSTESARRTATGLFAQGESRAAPQVLLSGGARVDVVRTNNTGGYFGSRTLSHEALSGFGAVVVGPFQGLSFTAMLSRGFRDPTISDRFYRGPTGRGFITGNPDLSPERSLQVDLGARYTSSRLRVALYGYHYRITDLVERYSTSTDFFFFRNRGRADVRGVELEAQLDLGAGLTADVAAQTSRGKAMDDTPRAGAPAAWLDDIGADVVSMTLRKRIQQRGSVHTRVAAYLRDARPGPSEIDSPGYTLVDAGAGWRLTPNVELRALGRNLLNQAYYASPDPRWVHAPGRHASLTIVVSH